MPSCLDSAEYEVFARTQGVVIGENRLRIEPAIDQRLRAEGQARPQRERLAHPAAKAVEGKKIPRGKPRAGSSPAPDTSVVSRK